eukprot:m.426859 g.426859  ORF g.426859 m.426859 type:complete len:58 (+) comp16863_c0_seq15:216-389(+)
MAESVPTADRTFWLSARAVRCTLVQGMRCFFGDKTEYTQTCHGSVGSIAQPSLAMLP